MILCFVSCVQFLFFSFFLFLYSRTRLSIESRRLFIKNKTKQNKTMTFSHLPTTMVFFAAAATAAVAAVSVATTFYFNLPTIYCFFIVCLYLCCLFPRDCSNIQSLYYVYVFVFIYIEKNTSLFSRSLSH